MITQTRKIAQTYGLHSFLLPLFFVLHNYVRYYGLASPGVAFRLLLAIEIAFGCFFGVLLLITRHVNRSLQITTLLGFLILFYGVLKDFFSDTLHASFLAKYTVLLPLTGLLCLLLIVRISRKTDFRRANLFQNTLLILFLLADGITLALTGGRDLLQRNQLVKHEALKPDTLAMPAGRPDVYFLVFDSYPGTDFLQQYASYDNTPFDSLLRSKGFYVAAHPRSNYNHTALSIASTLNFEYLQTIAAHTQLKPGHYNQASLSIRQATAPAVFMRLGYEIHNLSIFDLHGHPALWKEDFLVLPEKQMLLYNTLWERARHDILWHFPSLVALINSPAHGHYEDDLVQKSYLQKDFNHRAVDSLLKMPSLPAGSPRFVYAHFYLPHPPFFYDSSGRELHPDVNKIKTSMEDKKAFVSYLKYTNHVIETIVTALLKDTRRRPVVLLQSDHGYRDFRADEAPLPAQYMNYAAYYFPDGNYAGLYDTISNINTFPVVFNKYFNTHIRLRKDSLVLLPY